MNKKAGAKLTLTIAIMIVVILILLSLLFLSKDVGDNPVKKFVKDVVNVVTGNDDSNPDTSTPENPIYPSGGVSGGGGSGGGSSGGSSSPSSSSLSCHPELISYSLENLWINDDCKNYNGEICIKKDINCSVVAKNRDDSGGDFELIIYFVEEGKSKTDSFDSTSTRVFIPAHENFSLQDLKTVESTGVEGLANQNLTCFFNTLEVPTKEVCI